jgi:alpha-tubulin suppressor-like RCC1 family protein
MQRLAKSSRWAIALVVVAVGAWGLTGCVLDRAPTIGTATAGDRQALVSWQPPRVPPTPITAYVVTPWIGFTRQTPVVFNSGATTEAVTGLTNGVTYTFTVHAVHAHGHASPESGMSNPVTPTPTRLALYGWGYNGFGQLGDGTTNDRHTPGQVGTDTNWATMTTGWQHTEAIKTDGTLWAWGDNFDGQLGIDSVDSDPHYSPVQIGTATNWATVAASEHTVALQTDGTLWAWGLNAFGDTGHDCNSLTWPLRQVGTDADWATMAAGSEHTVAVKTDGTLWAAGRDDFGQVGDGTFSACVAPLAKIGTDTDWATVAAGGNPTTGHTLAIKTDGTLWSWGDNDSGQLGDGTTTTHSSPAQAGTATNWASVAAGGDDSAAIKTDGTLWAWGANDSGQLGDGTTTNRTSPVQIGTATNWASVSSGPDHTVAVKTDGTLWAWGYNGQGQLGDGTTTNRTSPVQIGLGHQWVTVSADRGFTMALAAS